MHRPPGPSGSAAVRAALDRLAEPPASAPIDLTLDAGNGRRVQAHAGDPAGDWTASALQEAGFWHRLASAYGADLGTPHLPVGGACGLQHYAGRVVLAVLGVWLQTGRLLPLSHRAWRLRLTARGHTVAVRPPTVSAGDRARLEEVAEALLNGHMRSIVDAVREATRITDRVAYGCIAASCAGAFGRLHRCTTAEGRSRLVAVARRFHDLALWPSDRSLLDLTEIAVPGGTALVHQRRVCCLIRLGRDHGACAACPDIDPADRWVRIMEEAESVPHSYDLPMAAFHA